MGYINNKTFIVGSGNGEYNGLTGKFVDTFMKQEVSHIIANDQAYNSGFTQDATNFTLDLSGLFTPPYDDGFTVTAVFTSPILFFLNQ